MLYDIPVPHLVSPISLWLLPVLTQLLSFWATEGLHPGTDSMQRSWGLFPAAHSRVQLIFAVTEKTGQLDGEKGWLGQGNSPTLAQHDLCEVHRGTHPIKLCVSYGGIKQPSLTVSLCWDTEMIHVSPPLWILAHGVLQPTITRNPWGRLALDREPLVHLSPCWNSHRSLECRRAVTLLNTEWPQLPQMSNLCLEISGSIPAIGFIHTTAVSAESYALC